ncbi:hypothetical protein OROHE_026504 [Orobanche hederae]
MEWIYEVSRLRRDEDMDCEAGIDSESLENPKFVENVTCEL